MRFDTIVLGAGIVGVSVAVHLQQRGRAVALVDRRAPGFETSFGNAGLIQREGVYPYAFPRDLPTLLRYASNTSADVHYHLGDLPRLLPFLWRYWRNSHPGRHAAIARAYAPLIAHSVTEHRALAEAAGATDLIRPSGWIKVFRNAATQDEETRTVERWQREYGVAFETLDPARLRTVEPHLDPSLLGGLRYTEADSVSDPNALVTAYANYFEQIGGQLFEGDANSLTSNAPWLVRSKEGELRADNVVIAMGPWADVVTSRLGYSLPLAVKRGYHMHYAPTAGTQLNHPVLDADGGYVLAPMARGIRLTTGAELAHRDAPKTPVQLEAVEPVARKLFPLAERVDAEPWMGARPCTPDMLPIIGQAPHHPSMWFAFGHAHHGLTLGPITGRLIAEMMTGETPTVDVRPFRAERFWDSAR
ncbi:FAD-binding oxidoreductase [Ralstonia insidiosa]|uniref:Amino acid dehydrogenase n=1 Tax=Ralstonia insidiosa TaxID=190721 RepID=A0A192A5Q2_9RALS|nr:FAD-binding oxidoreductase [Ralstonia insidiosa]ANJ75668.1 amino acid dehydrogenase [Ralstonia insidiosa]KAB0469536.1 FAD-binding oxidoreductase [Ralstonia insidiosa]MBY4910230.1 FAD-binding oxidoreductase [Ralstonia insidiosa]